MLKLPQLLLPIILTLSAFTNNTEFNVKKESKQNMPESKVNTNDHMRSTNSAKEIETASLPPTVLRLSHTN